MYDVSGLVAVRDVPQLRATLDRRVRAGEMVRLLPGFYAPADTFEYRAAAVARWNPDAVLCAAAAARLTYAPRQDVPVIDVAVRTQLRRAGYRFTRRAIPIDYVMQRGAVRMTIPALTALDLATEVGADAIDEALRARAVRLSELWAALRACPGRAGNQERLRMLVDSRDVPWSAAERLAHRLLRRCGITGWRANYPVTTPTGRYFIDIAFRGVRLAVEVDGRHHDRLDVFEYDRHRQNELVAAGWTVLRVTWLMLTEDPDGVVELIRSTQARLRRNLRTAG